MNIILQFLQCIPLGDHVTRTPLTLGLAANFRLGVGCTGKAHFGLAANCIWKAYFGQAVGYTPPKKSRWPKILPQRIQNTLTLYTLQCTGRILQGSPGMNGTYWK